MIRENTLPKTPPEEHCPVSRCSPRGSHDPTPPCSPKAAQRSLRLLVLTAELRGAPSCPDDSSGNGHDLGSAFCGTAGAPPPWHSRLPSVNRDTWCSPWNPESLVPTRKGHLLAGHSGSSALPLFLNALPVKAWNELRRRRNAHGNWSSSTLGLMRLWGDRGCLSAVLAPAVFLRIAIKNCILAEDWVWRRACLLARGDKSQWVPKRRQSSRSCEGPAALLPSDVRCGAGGGGDALGLLRLHGEKHTPTPNTH